MNRPTGVTVIAILYFLSAGLFILLGIGLIAGGSLAGMAASGGGGPEGAAAMGMLAGLGVVGAVISIGFALLPGITGFGLWKLKNWGRIIALIFAGLGALGQVAQVLMSLVSMEIITLIVGGCMLAINVWIFLYLLKPHVKAAFGAA